MKKNIRKILEDASYAEKDTLANGDIQYIIFPNKKDDSEDDDTNTVYDYEATEEEKKELEKLIYESDAERQEIERKLSVDKIDLKIGQILNDVKDGEIIVQPEWQRESVWSTRQKSSLIESLLLNIPIPSVFFAETQDFKHEVIDGQQRIRSFDEFFNNKFKLINLSILPELNGKKYDDLTEDIQRKFRNIAIRVITVKKESDDRTKFDLFYRINTGAKKLSKQEVRNALYYKNEAYTILQALHREFVVDSKIIGEMARGRDKEILARLLGIIGVQLNIIDFQGRRDDIINKWYGLTGENLKMTVDEFRKKANLLISKKIDIKTIYKDSFKILFVESLFSINWSDLEKINKELLKNVVEKIEGDEDASWWIAKAYPSEEVLKKIRNFILNEIR